MGVYDVINSKLLELMDDEELPFWEKSWNSSVSFDFVNALSDRSYSGINVFMAFLHTIRYGYSTRAYIAKSAIVGNKARKLPDGSFRYSIKKGAHAMFAIFWLWPTPKQMQEYRESVEAGNPIKKPTPRSIYHMVFNLDSIVFHDSIEREKLYGKYEYAKESKSFNNEHFDAMLASLDKPVPILEAKQNRACYMPALDQVIVPTREQFKTPANFYKTVLHEVAHATGHSSRLNRESGMSSVYGTQEYAYEELIAELSATYLCGILGISDAEREVDLLADSAAYIKGWSSVLKNGGSGFFIHAAQAAQKVVNYALCNLPESFGYSQYVSDSRLLEKGEVDYE